MLYLLFYTLILDLILKIFNNNNLEYRLKIISIFWFLILVGKIISLNNINRLYEN